MPKADNTKDSTKAALGVEALILTAQFASLNLPEHLRLRELQILKASVPRLRAQEILGVERMMAARVLASKLNGLVRLKAQAKLRGVELLRQKLRTYFDNHRASIAVSAMIDAHLSQYLRRNISDARALNFIDRYLQLEFRFTPTSIPSGILNHPATALEWLMHGKAPRASYRLKAITQLSMCAQVRQRKFLERLILNGRLFQAREARRQLTQNPMGMPIMDTL